MRSRSQGGAGSTYAALQQGVPVAIWPSNRNHEILGRMLGHAGIGAFVTELADLRPDELRKKVAAMEDEIRRKGISWGPESGPATAAEILLTMI